MSWPMLDGLGLGLESPVDETVDTQLFLLVHHQDQKLRTGLWANIDMDISQSFKTVYYRAAKSGASMLSIRRLCNE